MHVFGLGQNPTTIKTQHSVIRLIACFTYAGTIPGIGVLLGFLGQTILGFWYGVQSNGKGLNQGYIQGGTGFEPPSLKCLFDS